MFKKLFIETDFKFVELYQLIFIQNTDISQLNFFD